MEFNRAPPYRRPVGERKSTVLVLCKNVFKRFIWSRFEASAVWVNQGSWGASKLLCGAVQDSLCATVVPLQLNAETFSVGKGRRSLCTEKAYNFGRFPLDSINSDRWGLASAPERGPLRATSAGSVLARHIFSWPVRTGGMITTGKNRFALNCQYKADFKKLWTHPLI